MLKQANICLEGKQNLLYIETNKQTLYFKNVTLRG